MSWMAYRAGGGHAIRSSTALAKQFAASPVVATQTRRASTGAHLVESEANKTSPQLGIAAHKQRIIDEGKIEPHNTAFIVPKGARNKFEAKMGKTPKHKPSIAFDFDDVVKTRADSAGNVSVVQQRGGPGKSAMMGWRSKNFPKGQLRNRCHFDKKLDPNLFSPSPKSSAAGSPQKSAGGSAASGGNVPVITK